MSALTLLGVTSMLLCALIIYKCHRNRADVNMETFDCECRASPPVYEEIHPVVIGHGMKMELNNAYIFDFNKDY